MFAASAVGARGGKTREGHMAPAMILSSLSQSCLQPAHQCGKVAPTTASSVQGARGLKPVSKAYRSFLSGERLLQSQFSSQALRLRRERRHASVVGSSRAELAADADKGNVIDVTDRRFLHQLAMFCVEILCMQCLSVLGNC